jgi:hypothetical protein
MIGFRVKNGVKTPGKNLKSVIWNEIPEGMALIHRVLRFLIDGEEDGIDSNRQ